MTKLELELIETLLLVVEQSMTKQVLKVPVLDPDLLNLPDDKCALRLLESLGMVEKWDVNPSYYFFTDKALNFVI